MPSKHETRGVWTAILTPLGSDGAIDTGLMAQHIRTLFDLGIDGVTPFGTTGEGQSFTVAERRAALEALLRAGIPAERIIVGIGCAALPDTIELARHALSQGVNRTLMLPPFFFKNIDEDGVYTAFARTIDAVADERLRLFLYHIPQISAVPIHHGAIARLVAAYPRAVAGIKDSLGEWPHTQALLRQFPSLAIFVGAEQHLPLALANGGVGTICGMANVVPQLMRQIYDTAGTPAGAVLVKQIETLANAITTRPFIAAAKAVMAHATGDQRWRNVRSPLVPLPASSEQALLAEFAKVGAALYARKAERVPA